MKIHFGTDGIRGVANETLTAGMAFRMGQFLGNYYSAQRKGRILIGKDTRLSCDMLESALAAGATACGSDVYLTGICSTPSLIYMVRTGGFDCGIMISASHNPYTDNGIKVIDGAGTKMNSEVEKQIEDYIYGQDQLDLAKAGQIGRCHDYSEGLQDYLNNLQKQFPADLSGYKIALDCANGSSTVTAEKIFRRLNAEVLVTNNQPDGLNINRNCGSTHPEGLVEFVKANKCDVGFAYDGDADRVIAVAGDGQIVDGDKILYSCGKYLDKKGRLAGGKIVTTVMANLGLFKKLDEYSIGYEKTQVGDKYVYQNMTENGYVIGGEQSGHIIFSEYATTGDGVLTSLFIMDMLKDEGKTLNQLTDDLVIFPQLLVNVPVKDKEKAMKDPDVQAMCRKVEEELHGMGRALVRASGTESLVRVMAEADSEETCRKYVYQVVDLIKEKNF